MTPVPDLAYIFVFVIRILMFGFFYKVILICIELYNYQKG